VKKYNYQAKDRASNKIVKSSVQANSEQDAAKLLISQGFTPLDIKEAGLNDNFIEKLSGRITTKDKVVFSRQLSTLIGAGLPLAQSLHTVSEQTENKQLRSVVEEITASVEGGQTLSSSFAKHPKVFDNVFIALIAAGETSGTLDGALQRLAAQQEKDAAMMSKIRGAMTYPVIVLLVIFGVMIFMLTTVVPQVEDLYKSLGKKLPIMTQIMVDSAHFLTNFWWLALIILVLAVYFIRNWLKTDSGVDFMDKFKLKVPLFKGMFQRMYMGRFARTAQTLLTSGVSMLDMLQVTSRAVNNSVIESAIKRASNKVQSGKALSTALEAEKSFSSLVPQMIKIGEQSGKIDEMMGKVAQVYEDELDEQIRTISTAIEPILMVVLAIVAGGMVGAILLPIYSLVNSINV